MEDVQEIRFPKRLPDFGLSARGRVIRNRLTAIGYRLGRARGGSEWTVSKVWLGAPDELRLRVTSLNGVELWLKKREEQIFAKADLVTQTPSIF
jgi:hypothetical protein